MKKVVESLRHRFTPVIRTDRGFTLIELLVVVIIIGVLAAIAIPVYIGVQNNAKDSAVKSDLGNAKTAVAAYYTQVGSYPTSLTQAAGTSPVTPSMASLGYTQSALTNYDGTTTAPVYYKGSNGAFCIYAKSSTTNTFAVSDSTTLTQGKTCKSDGTIQ